MFTVMVLEPCCSKTAPGYVPGPKPYYVRTPGWSDTCDHPRDKRRVPVITRHADRESAEAEFAKTKGWDGTGGWIFEGAMPPEGERHQCVLFNIVGDMDTRVRWSSYNGPVGTELTPGDGA